MKKLFFATIILISLTVSAQINEGGKPHNLLNENITNDIAIFELDAANINSLIAKASTFNGRDGGMEQIGVIAQTNLTPYNSGTWTTLENGDRVWRLQIESKNAKALTLYYNNFYLPSGAKLFLYNADYSQIIGSFTNANVDESGDFATEMIYGETTIIEYFEPQSVQYLGIFTIDEVGHTFKSVYNPYVATDDFGDSQSCEVNINCSEGSNWQDEKRGVARILVKAGANFGWCSGSLINTTAQDCSPYFLTAFHCGDGSSNADFNQWIFYFNYEANGCSTPSIEPNSNSITGASVISSSNNGGSSSSDFLLLELNQNIPDSYDVYYNGWNRSTSASTGGVSIHHPAGDIKKISTYTSTLQSTQWGSATGSHWRVFWASTANGHGVTEGGSSGSPIFNNNGQIVGTLTGGGSFCTQTNAPDSYGKLSYHWNSNGTANNRRLDIHLDPVGNGSATSIGGADSPCSTTTSDAGITSIESPADELCGLSFTPQVVLRNFGSATLTSSTISYKVDNGAAQTFNWSGSLSQNATETVTLNPMTTTAGAHTFSAETTNANGGNDEDTNNNSSSKSFTASSAASTTLPVIEGFETSTLQNGWAIANSDNDITWERETAYGYQSNSCYIIDNWDYNAPGNFDWLVTDFYDFTSANNPTLTFDYAYAYYDGSQGVATDSLIVAYSLDCGNNFTPFYWEGGADLATVGGQSTEYTFENDNDWSSESFDLSSLVGNSSIQFAFIGLNGYGNTLAIDNINISNGGTTGSTFFADSDGDGFGDAGNSVQATSAPAGFVSNSSDCNDNNSAINPSATEICDGIDNNCNNQVDEGCVNITEIEDINSIDIYPNPTNSNINISLDFVNVSDVKISIHNVVGQIIAERNIDNFQSEIIKFNMKGQSDGIYIIRIESQGQITTSKFVKN